MTKLKGESNIVGCEGYRVVEHTDGIGWDIFIRMELLKPLTEYTKENTLDREDVIRLGIELCKALELYGDYNIIHRDIKPENIFVSENGRFNLGDFGIAKTAGGLSDKDTNAYMAPEAYKGDACGASVDIYSLGIVLYRYMNDNRTPFLPDFPKPIEYTDRQKAQVLRNNGKAIPAPAKADKALADVILKACAYKPEDRYANPAEMREALEAAAKGSAAGGILGNTGKIGNPKKTRSDTIVFDYDEKNIEELVSTVEDDGAESGLLEEVTETGRAADDAEDVNVTKNDDKGKRKKKRRIIPTIISAMLLIAIIMGIATSCGPGNQPYWTIWMTKLPRGVTESDYEIQTKTQYRSSHKETISSNTPDEMDGWTLEEIIDGGDFGPWSPWSQEPAAKSDTREVESETHYRSRNLETTTSKSSSKPGWTLVNTTYALGEYGPWSPWSTTPASSSASRKVETKTQYSSRSVSYTTKYSNWGS